MQYNPAQLGVFVYLFVSPFTCVPRCHSFHSSSPHQPGPEPVGLRPGHPGWHAPPQSCLCPAGSSSSSQAARPQAFKRLLPQSTTLLSPSASHVAAATALNAGVIGVTPWSGPAIWQTRGWGVQRQATGLPAWTRATLRYRVQRCCYCGCCPY